MQAVDAIEGLGTIRRCLAGLIGGSLHNRTDHADSRPISIRGCSIGLAQSERTSGMKRGASSYWATALSDHPDRPSRRRGVGPPDCCGMPSEFPDRALKPPAARRHACQVGESVAVQPPLALADFFENAGLPAARRAVAQASQRRLVARGSAARAIGSPSTIANLGRAHAQGPQRPRFAHLAGPATGSPPGEVSLMNPEAPDSLDGPVISGRCRSSHDQRPADATLDSRSTAITRRAAHPEPTPHRNRKEAPHAPVGEFHPHEIRLCPGYVRTFDARPRGVSLTKAGGHRGRERTGLPRPFHGDGDLALRNNRRGLGRAHGEKAGRKLLSVLDP